MQICFCFSYLDPVEQSTPEAAQKTKVWNYHPSTRSMLSKTRKMLTNFYQPFNEQLAQFMGDDSFLWLNT